MTALIPYAAETDESVKGIDIPARAMSPSTGTSHPSKVALGHLYFVFV